MEGKAAYSAVLAILLVLEEESLVACLVVVVGNLVGNWKVFLVRRRLGLVGSRGACLGGEEEVSKS